MKLSHWRLMFTAKIIEYFESQPLIDFNPNYQKCLFEFHSRNLRQKKCEKSLQYWITINKIFWPISPIHCECHPSNRFWGFVVSIHRKNPSILWRGYSQKQFSQFWNPTYMFSFVLVYPTFKFEKKIHIRQKNIFKIYKFTTKIK